MTLLRTTRFGTLNVVADDVIVFPAGLLGLEDCREWVLLSDASNESLGWLQSMSRPETALAVVSPRRFVPQYRFRTYRSELAPLDLAALDDAQVLTIVSHHDGRPVLNLKAPIVVNLRTRTARQIVANDDQPLQFALPTGSARIKKIA
jgi:flagellar assembly factor FliW